MRLHYKLLVGGILGAIGACSSDNTPPGQIGNGGSSGDPGTTGGTGGTPGGGGDGTGGTFIFPSADASCGTKTCAELGWACGYTVDLCDNLIDCADEGLVCQPNEACQGGIDGPTECVPAGEACELCLAVADCSAAPQKTRLTGRVVTPGRDDDDVGNQVGVPNAFVYIARDGVAGLPAIGSGIPTGGTSCDRCEDQQDELGPVVDGAVTDAQGNFSFDERVPVGQEFALVVKAGKFRRAITMTIPADEACTTRALPTTLAEGNPTRLPRSVDPDFEDGLAVNIPRIAISTGQIDAMECVFEKMGIAHSEFGNPGADGTAAPRVHLYRGGPNTGSPPGAGARIDSNTPHASALYNSLARLQSYDMIVSDCEGQTWDGDGSERTAGGGNVREYVNRGGRMFASHLSFSWLHQNGTAEYTEEDPIATGLGNAGRTWDTNIVANQNLNTSGTGVISVDTVARPQASPRIQVFADWLENEDAEPTPNAVVDNQFTITDPRSMAMTLAPLDEEFVHRSDGNARVQQFSFNTPYGAPEEATCGRIAYSGFHVAATSGDSDPFASSTFPAHCTGSLTPQEKVLLFMLFDLGACVGENPPVVPECTPRACDSNSCGFIPDGCGNVLDCGPCRPVIPT